MNDPQLMKYLNFDESDLQANRSGRITEKQLARLKTKESGSKAGALFLGLICMASALLGLGIGMLAVIGDGAVSTNLGLKITLAAVFGCVWPLIWGGMGVFTLRRVFAKMEVKVNKAEGPINIVKAIRRNYNPSTKTRTEHTVYELRVGGRTFEVGAGLPNYMAQGDLYAVYFAEFNLKDKKKEVLSAELLTGKSAQVARETLPGDDAEVIEYLKQGDMMKAIRAHRSIHGGSYEDARGAVEEIKSRLGY